MEWFCDVVQNFATRRSGVTGYPYRIIVDLFECAALVMFGAIIVDRLGFSIVPARTKAF